MLKKTSFAIKGLGTQTYPGYTEWDPLKQDCPQFDLNTTVEMLLDLSDSVDEDCLLDHDSQTGIITFATEDDMLTFEPEEIEYNGEAVTVYSICIGRWVWFEVIDPINVEDLTVCGCGFDFKDPENEFLFSSDAFENTEHEGCIEVIYTCPTCDQEYRRYEPLSNLQLHRPI